MDHHNSTASYFKTGKELVVRVIIMHYDQVSGHCHLWPSAGTGDRCSRIIIMLGSMWYSHQKKENRKYMYLQQTLFETLIARHVCMATMEQV